MRLSDICKLTWRDVQTAYSHAKNPKGGQVYGIHMDVPMVAPMLEERRKMFPNARQHGLLSAGEFVYAEALPVSHKVKREVFMLER